MQVATQTACTRYQQPFKNMKTKLPLILMLLWMAGCQPKSEVDKCVDVRIQSECRNKPSPNLSNSECKKAEEDIYGYQYRLECMRAQAGKE